MKTPRPAPVQGVGFSHPHRETWRNGCHNALTGPDRPADSMGGAKTHALIPAQLVHVGGVPENVQHIS